MWRLAGRHYDLGHDLAGICKDPPVSGLSKHRKETGGGLPRSA